MRRIRTILVDLGLGILVVALLTGIMTAIASSRIGFWEQRPRLWSLLFLGTAAVLLLRMAWRVPSGRPKTRLKAITGTLCVVGVGTWVFVGFADGSGSVAATWRETSAYVAAMRSAAAAELATLSSANSLWRYRASTHPEIRWVLAREVEAAEASYGRRVVAEIGRELNRFRSEYPGLGALSLQAARFEQVEAFATGSRTALREALRAALIPARDRMVRDFEAMSSGDFDRYRELTQQADQLRALDPELPMAELDRARDRSLARSVEAVTARVRAVGVGDIDAFLAGRTERCGWAELGLAAAKLLQAEERRWLESSIDSLVRRAGQDVGFEAACAVALDADRLVTSFFPEVPWSRKDTSAIAVLLLPRESYQPRVDALQKAVNDRISAALKTEAVAGAPPPDADPLDAVRQTQAVRERLLELAGRRRVGSNLWVTWDGAGDLVLDPDILLIGRLVEAFNRAVALTTVRVRDAIRADRFREARDLIDRVTNGLRFERDDLQSWALARLRTETYEQLGRMRSTVDYVEALKARAGAVADSSRPGP